MALRRREVVWAERAKLALNDALNYIATDSPLNATRLAQEVLDEADSLATLSERGRMVPEVGDPTLRELLINPFRLMYEVHETEVNIVGFLHQRQLFSPGR
jgi:plasmid stabilization system protein ParE